MMERFEAPDVVIVADILQSSAHQFGESIKRNYGTSVMLIVGPPDGVQVYGCHTTEARSLPALIEEMIKVLDYDEQQKLYEQLFEMGHRLR